MGWNPNEGYYQKHVEVRGFSNKITEEQRAFNKLAIEDTREGIQIAAQQLNKESGKDKIQELTEKLVDNIEEHIDEYPEFQEFQEQDIEQER